MLILEASVFLSLWACKMRVYFNPNQPANNPVANKFVGKYIDSTNLLSYNKLVGNKIVGETQNGSLLEVS